MITMLLDPASPIPMYEQLYRHLRAEIEEGRLVGGEKLPSKRRLAVHLRISQSTVENAYGQLVAEGYASARERSGHYVSHLEPAFPPAPGFASDSKEAEDRGLSGQDPDNPAIPLEYDLKTNAADASRFPFATWNSLIHATVSASPRILASDSPPQGNEGFREEIARYLRQFRGMDIHPSRIVVGAGSEVLLRLLVDLLANERFALENPGYVKLAKILALRGTPYTPFPVDRDGMDVSGLEASGAKVVFLTPSNQFPMNVPMSIARRQRVLSWARETGGWIVEDDFDTEFRFVHRPVPSLYSQDTSRRVIYLNSFAKTLSPSLRVAYIVLPDELLAAWRARLSFFSCSVSEFEQRTLAAFLRQGHYERHISRMRGVYRMRRDLFLAGLREIPALQVSGTSAGLHLLLSKEGVPASELISRAREHGVGVYALSDYATGEAKDLQTAIAGYAALSEQDISQVVERLARAWGSL